MNTRPFFLCSATLLLLFVNGAVAGDGGYRRTRDGKTLVWDNYPASGERADWSGKRDEDGYATGNGTLTWYKPKRTIFTVAERHEVVFADRFTGKMVRGKFNGPVVSVDASGKTMHATFASGSRTGDWTAGPAAGPKRTGIAPDHPPLQNPGATEQRDETSDRGAEAKVPAEGSPPVLVHPPSQDHGARKSAGQNVSPPAKEPTTPVTDSPRSVTAPPSSLHLPDDASPQPSIPPTTSSSPAAAPLLTTPDVIQLADAEARVNGHVLREYQNPQAEYIATNDTWSVSYDQKSDAAHKGSKHFTIRVDDKTKKTSMGTDR